VAVDHGFFNQPNLLSGIEDMRKGVRTLVDAAPDAIQLTLGRAWHLPEIPGRFKPSLVLRTDVANIYGKELPASRFSLMMGVGEQRSSYGTRPIKLLRCSPTPISAGQ
jgi:fructose-bisphosphate aldolase, class I